jgi:Tfp pilus assembly protein PilN
MIIRNNLALNPLRNYSLYFIGCIALVVISIGFAVFNATSLKSWYEENRSLQQKISEQQRKRSVLQREEASLRSKIAEIKTPEFVMETEFINKAIKRRVFSWTTLFDQFERVLPNNVKMVSVLPTISDEQIAISMEVAAKGLNDLFELITVFQNTPAFKKVVLKSERQENDGLHYATISLVYLPEHAQAIQTVKKDVSSANDRSVDEEQTDPEEEVQE